MNAVFVLKQLVWKFLNRLSIGGYIQLMLKSSLKDWGWFRSYHTKQSVDVEGNPIPWFTYPAIAFLSERLKSHFIVYEYGSGNSTLWFASRTSNVVSIEHDKKWHQLMLHRVPHNVTLMYAELEDELYENHILTTPYLYDIIVIDGRKRALVAVQSLKKLKNDGVIIFDNSERPHYQNAIEIIENKGFKRIDFWGIGPIIHMQTCTTIFYRPDNCLNI